MPPTTKITVSSSVRLSTTSALATIVSLMSHCQIESPAVTASVSDREHRHHLAADERRARQPDEQHDARADRQRDRGGQRLPVDLRAFDLRLGEQPGHRATASTVALTASSPDSSASCG